MRGALCLALISNRHFCHSGTNVLTFRLSRLPDVINLAMPCTYASLVACTHNTACCCRRFAWRVAAENAGGKDEGSAGQPPHVSEACRLPEGTHSTTDNYLWGKSTHSDHYLCGKLALTATYGVSWHTDHYLWGKSTHTYCYLMGRSTLTTTYGVNPHILTTTYGVSAHILTTTYGVGPHTLTTTYLVS